MPRISHSDPSRFFSVVGAPYISESRETFRYRPRLFDIGVATLSVAFCAGALGMSLFTGTGAAKLAQLANHVVQ